MQIYLVRHGETDYNRKRLIMGQMDILMNELGINQAKKLADALENKGITAIYSSDLSRAFKTAEIIGQKLGLNPLPTKEFREHTLGEMDGTEWTNDLEEMAFEDFEKIMHKVGAEDMLDFYNRVWDKFLKIVEKHPDDENLLFVIHGGCTRVIIMKILDATNEIFGALTQENCCINIVSYVETRKRQKFKIEKINETCHLDEYKTHI